MKLRANKLPIIVILILLLFACSMCVVNAASVTVKTATGKVNSDNGAFIRSKASTDSEVVYCADDNTKLTINKEVFVKKTSTKKADKWYYVTVKKKNGYIRSDLVDSISYSAVNGKTTDLINYRTGPGTTFKSVGTIKKGKSVSIVLKANVKGSSAVWYKIKKSNKYYYVKKTYVKLTSTATTTKKTTTPTSKVTVDVSGESLPSNIGMGSSFALKGEITASQPIEKVKFGIKNSKDAWVTYKELNTSGSHFNIADIDEYIKFGILTTGSFKYVGYVYIGGKSYTVIDHSFKVIKLKGPETILATAMQLAWPYGTPESKYCSKSETGEPDSDYKLATASLGYSGRIDDCSVFVRTVCVYSGYDKDYPGNITKQWDYLASSDKWTKVSTASDKYALEDELQPGDVVIYRKGSSSWHTCIYAGKIDGTGCIAEASRTLYYYGFIRKGITKITKTTDKELFAVYRAAS